MIRRREYLDLFVDSLDILEELRQTDPTRDAHPDDIFYDLSRHLEAFHATFLAIEATKAIKENNA